MQTGSCRGVVVFRREPCDVKCCVCVRLCESGVVLVVVGGMCRAVTVDSLVSRTTENDCDATV